eukprot:9907379-Karenia_brevis.AAC.1
MGHLGILRTPWDSEKSLTFTCVAAFSLLAPPSCSVRYICPAPPRLAPPPRADLHCLPDPDLRHHLVVHRLTFTALSSHRNLAPPCFLVT